MVWEEDIHICFANVALLGLVLVQEVWNISHHSNISVEISHSMANWLLLVQLHEHELEWWSPERFQRHAIQCLRWTRQWRNRTRCRKQSRIVQCAWHIKPLAIWIAIGPLACLTIK